MEGEINPADMAIKLKPVLNLVIGGFWQKGQEFLNWEVEHLAQRCMTADKYICMVALVLKGVDQFQRKHDLSAVKIAQDTNYLHKPSKSAAKLHIRTSRRI